MRYREKALQFESIKAWGRDGQRLVSRLWEQPAMIP